MEYVLAEIEHDGPGGLDPVAGKEMHLHVASVNHAFWRIGIPEGIPVSWERYSAAGPNKAVVVYQWCTRGECNADGGKDSIIVRSESEFPPLFIRGLLAFLKRRAEIMDSVAFQQEMMKGRAGGLVLPGLVGPDRGLVG